MSEGTRLESTSADSSEFAIPASRSLGERAKAKAKKEKIRAGNRGARQEMRGYLRAVVSGELDFEDD